MMTNPIAAPIGLAVFRQGLRPFFLLAGIWALPAMLLWLAGFIGAAMTGFLLTAIPNWTQAPPYAGGRLMAVAALHVAARLALLPGVALPPSVAAVVALLLLPAVLLLVLPALLHAATPGLFGPPLLVLLVWLGDVLMLGDAAGWWQGSFAAGELFALDVALLLVGLMAAGSSRPSPAAR